MSLPKCSTSWVHTTRPRSVGTKWRSLRLTYSLSCKVMMAAYVEGRPMPSSSSSRTRLASLKRAGGWVVLFLVELFKLEGLACGQRGSSASASSLPRGMAARKPAKSRRSPLAFHCVCAHEMVAVVS